MSLDALYSELEATSTSWNSLNDLLAHGKFDFDRKRPALDQQSMSTFRRRFSLIIETLLAVRPTDADSVEAAVVGARIQDLRSQLQNFQRHSDSTLSQLRTSWREKSSIKDGNENFAWQLFDEATNYANLDVTGNFQQMHSSLNALVAAVGAILPLCKAGAVGDLSARAEALSNTARDAEAARKQAQTHSNAAGGSASRAAEREKAAEDSLTQAQTLLAKMRELQTQATADASSVTTLVEQIKTIGSSAERLEASVSSYQSKFDAFQSQLELRGAQFTQFEADTEKARKENEARSSEIDRLTKLSDAMISGATTAGLAKSLEDTRSRYENRMLLAGGGFIFSVVLLVASALPLAAHLLPGVFGDWFPKVSEGAHASWYGVLGKLVLMIPATWLTAFFTKSFAEFFHLEREYAHKAALAMSVDGFKRQAPRYEEEITAEVFLEIKNNPAKGRPVEPASHPVMDAVTKTFGKAFEKKAS